LILWFVGNGLPVQAQLKGLVFSDYYSPADYNAGPQNWCVVQDQRGVMYFGNSHCVLEYDGVSWRSIEVANQSSVRSMDIDRHNNIFVGAYDELGILTPDKQGRMQYQSLTHMIDPEYADFGDVWNTYCMNDEVFFLTEKFIFRYKDQQFKYWEKSEDRFYLSFKVNDQLYVHELGKGLLVFENNSLQRMEKGDFFADKRVHTIIPMGDKLLIGTRANGLYLYHQTSRETELKSVAQISETAESLNKYFLEHPLYHGIKINDQLLALATINGSVLTVDPDFQVIDRIDKESTGIISPVYYLYFDQNQSLWMALDNGINRADLFSPFRYWTEDLGIIGNITDVASLDEYTYVATGSGIFYSTSNEQKQDMKVDYFYPVQGTFEQTWGFLYFFIPDYHLNCSDENILQKLETLESPSSDEALLLVATSCGLFQIEKNYSRRISDDQQILKVYQSNEDPSKIILGLPDGIAVIDYANGQWVNLGKPFDIHEQIRSIEEDSLGSLWVSAYYKGLYEIRNPFHKNNEPHQVIFHGEEKGLPSIKSIELARYKNQLLFISDLDYFKYDSETDSFLLADEIFEQEEDSSDVKASQEESSSDTLALYKVVDRLITTFYVTTYTDSSIWFGTTEGTFRYLNRYNKDYSHISPAIIRKVSTTSDSTIYYGTNYFSLDHPKEDTSSFASINASNVTDVGIELSYENNSLLFEYAFPFYDEESKNQYSYCLEGFDKTWSEWTSETKREYNNLREGEYVFKVKAKNIYHQESKPAMFKFRILPPWYRSFAAILGYIILGILMIIGIVRLYTYRLIREKEKLEEIVIQRTQEILMQKEEILVQAEHLKDANERISAKNKELEKQKWEITNQALQLKKANIELLKLSKVASETDNAISIFDKKGNIEWINHAFTRMYGYTLEQYKKEKHTNIAQISDNPNIKEAIATCLKDGKSVVYEYKTWSRKGVTLWVQTTLTPVVDKNDKTINLVAIDSDITKLKLAEQEILQQKKEIEQQRDELAVSNATKNKFFRIIAHDLRNPISTLANSTNLVVNDFDMFNREQTKNIIAELNRLSQTTFNLLENLLDWSSTQTGEVKFNPKPVDIRFIVDENIELVKRKINQKKIELKVSISGKQMAYADEDMIKAVLRNLLSNAVKFTPENGVIEILSQPGEDFLSITVKDKGIGIEPKDLPKLFRIDQHHSTPGLQNEKGSGLGLILCKEFVEKNGGTITIDSIPNQGTSITFTLRKYHESLT
jgi:PAS domain S-box-containing protein